MHRSKASGLRAKATAVATAGHRLLLAMVLITAAPHSVAAEESQEQALARQLANPLAALIQVPLELNYDEGFGAGEEGEVYALSLKPVIPFSLNGDWNLISRTILPIATSDQIPAGSDSFTGIGDTVQSFFFSPNSTTASGWIWGAGPVLILPTSTDDRFGPGEWGAGVTAVALRQQGPNWTYGFLTNHIRDVRGDVSINTTLVQPFLSYRTSAAWTFSLSSEASYDGNAEEWGVPINFKISKVARFGRLPVSIGAGVRYWAESTPGGAQDWGARLSFTLLLPKGMTQRPPAE